MGRWMKKRRLLSPRRRGITQYLSIFVKNLILLLVICAENLGVVYAVALE
jgi:hypothetical protein